MHSSHWQLISVLTFICIMLACMNARAPRTLKHVIVMLLGQSTYFGLVCAMAWLRFTVKFHSCNEQSATGKIVTR